MDGDGKNQDIIDNAFCSSWADQYDDNDSFAAAPAAGIGSRLTVQAFPGVSHMQMYTDEEVIARVQVALEELSVAATTTTRSRNH